MLVDVGRLLLTSAKACANSSCATCSDDINNATCQAGEDVVEEAFKVMFKQHGAKHSLETLLVLSKARTHVHRPCSNAQEQGLEHEST